MPLDFLVRAIVSGFIIAAIALVGRKAPALAAIIASLPLISILGMIWLWRDTGDSKLLADVPANPWDDARRLWFLAFTWFRSCSDRYSLPRHRNACRTRRCAHIGQHEQEYHRRRVAVVLGWQRVREYRRR
jgi:hypothetical protein